MQESPQSLLQPLSAWLDPASAAIDRPPTYWYEGQCRQTGQWLRLPRTALAEAVAHSLMRRMATDPIYQQEGKMYGVLLVADRIDQIQVLKAFSGLLDSSDRLEGWVPPIDGKDRIALTAAETIAQLDAIKQEIITLQAIPARQAYEHLSEQFAQARQQLQQTQRQQKQQRQLLRAQYCQTLTGAALTQALSELDDQSRWSGIELRRFKQNRDRTLQPLLQQIQQADDRIRLLKQRRKVMSQALQSQMHAAYALTNFAGRSLSLTQLGGHFPTGTGDCCAPKLLHYAATHQLRPLAMAEFWWGDPDNASDKRADKRSGEFYPACVERCQPLMGFLLSGLPTIPIAPADELPILYEDDWLIAIDKPAGLLSVPGRYADRQDSVLSRLWSQWGKTLKPVHRLDQDTSGILMVAKDPLTYRQLSQNFQQRSITKQYEALLTTTSCPASGWIDLPIGVDPLDRPKRCIDPAGKPSQTYFQRLSTAGDHARVTFTPITGRTHQLRLHAAAPQGLNNPIWGDRLYSIAGITDRLYLHAKTLEFTHPQTLKRLELRSIVPF